MSDTGIYSSTPSSREQYMSSEPGVSCLLASTPMLTSDGVCFFLQGQLQYITLHSLAFYSTLFCSIRLDQVRHLHCIAISKNWLLGQISFDYMLHSQVFYVVLLCSILCSLLHSQPLNPKPLFSIRFYSALFSSIVFLLLRLCSAVIYAFTF